MPKLKQGPSTRLQTGISVHLKKSLEILSYNTLELAQNLQKALTENVFLEEIQAPAITLDEFMLRQAASQGDGENQFESYTSREKSLQDYLLEQVSLSELKPRERELAELIITSIDKKGWVNEDHESLALHNGFSRKELMGVIDFLIQLDPGGVCARDTWQSLEWQARAKYPEDQVLLDIIAVFQQGKKEIKEFDENTTQELISFLHISEAHVRNALEKLKTLEVNPAAKYSRDERQYIVPELTFSVKNETIQVSFLNPLLPEVQINSAMLASLKNDKNKQTWKEMHADAMNLVKSIEYRKNSMMRIAKIIASKQKQYFLRGEAYLKPMILKDIARVTELNISTISRIMKNKYCVTPYGIVPLSHFLVKKIKGINNENLGVEDLKKTLLLVITAENPQNPLSDAQLSDKLKEYNFNVQRRTVTKYRKLLHIPSAKQRKAGN